MAMEYATSEERTKWHEAVLEGNQHLEILDLMEKQGFLLPPGVSEATRAHVSSLFTDMVVRMRNRVLDRIWRHEELLRQYPLDGE